MAEQIIQCTSACTVTVVHDVNLPLLNLTLDQAAVLMIPITLVFCVAWGFRATLRFINSPDNSTSERAISDD